jgi:hypothetical protein
MWRFPMRKHKLVTAILCFISLPFYDSRYSRDGQTMLPKWPAMVQITWCKGGTGKAEDAKLQDAGTSLKQCPGK